MKKGDAVVAVTQIKEAGLGGAWVQHVHAEAGERGRAVADSVDGMTTVTFDRTGTTTDCHETEIAAADA